MNHAARQTSQLLWERGSLCWACRMTSERSKLTGERARSFGRVAQKYQAARPSYPDDAIDWLVPNDARRVLDLGAGTGKLTEALVARGYDVVAVEPSAEMLEQLIARLPTVDSRQGTAEDIPLDGASVDVVTVAQAWHWVDADTAVPEVARVLRPGGLLSLVWNAHDDRVPWVRQLEDILGKTPHFDAEEESPQLREYFEPVESWSTEWRRPLTLDELETYIASLSYVSLRTPDEQNDIFERVREVGQSVLTDAGVVELPYITECSRARLSG